MTSYKHKEYGRQDGSNLQEERGSPFPKQSFLLFFVIALMIAATGFFIFGVFYLLGDNGALQRLEERQKACLRELAAQYTISSVSDVVDDGGVITPRIKVYQEFQKSKDSATDKNKVDPYSIFDMMGAEVTDLSGINVGIIYDILAHRNNRQAIALVMNKKGVFYVVDLEQLHIIKGQRQPPDVQIKSVLEDHKIFNKRNFYHGDSKTQDWTSLRQLKQEILQGDGCDRD